MGNSREEKDISRPTTGLWSSKDEKVAVTEDNGFHIALTAKVNGDPSTVYGVLTVRGKVLVYRCSLSTISAPDSCYVNHQEPFAKGIFRSIKACLQRRIMQDDGRGRRQLEVRHRAITKFLFISITFDTTLLVWEDAVERKV